MLLELRGDAAVPQLYTLLHQDLSTEASFGILDCSTKLPSGKSIQQRFNIDTKWTPSIAAFVPWEKHRQLPPSTLKEHVSARRFLRPLLDPIPYHARALADMKKRCKSITCVVLASDLNRYKDTKELQRTIVRSNPRIRFIHVDRSALHLPEFDGMQSALSIAVLKQLTDYRAYTGAMDVPTIRSFIQTSMQEDAQFAPLPPRSLVLSETSQEKVQRQRQQREQFKVPTDGDEPQSADAQAKEPAAPEADALLTPEQLQRQREMKLREELDRMQDEIISAVDPDDYVFDEEDEDYEEDTIIDLD